MNKTLPQLLQFLGDHEITIRTNGDSLSYSSPRTVLQHDTLSDLRRHRDQLRHLLNDPLHLHHAAQVVFDERMGIAVDQGMKTDPGSPAWLTAIGEALGTKPDPLDDPERASTVAALVASKPKPKVDHAARYRRGRFRKT